MPCSCPLTYRGKESSHIRIVNRTLLGVVVYYVIFSTYVYSMYATICNLNVYSSLFHDCILAIGIMYTMNRIIMAFLFQSNVLDDDDDFGDFGGFEVRIVISTSKIMYCYQPL